MLVFFDQRLVILATPKTATTAITAATESLAHVSIQRPPALKHTNVQRYHRFIGPYLHAAAGGAPFEVVALMREPRDWLGSWFRYRRREVVPKAGRRTAGVSFDDFVTAWSTRPTPDFARVGSQARFLLPPSGVRVDLLFRHEAMEAFVAFLEDRLKTRVTLPRLNVSPEADLSLTPESEARLRNAAAVDFALYAALAGAASAPWGALRMAGASGGRDAGFRGRAG